MEYKVEKNVPLPNNHYGSYPFKDMDIGDSFLLHGWKERGKIGNAATKYGRRNNKKFRVLNVEGDTYRCYRVS